MASEWFNTAWEAVRFGHRPLYDIVRRPVWHNLTAETALSQLAAKGFVIALSFDIEDAYAASQDFLDGIVETTPDILPWVSFRHNDRVHFAFSRLRDAAIFRLLWTAY